MEDWKQFAYRELRIAYEKAEQKIKQDFHLLKSKLHTPFCEGKNSQAFVENNVCSAALDSFKQCISDSDKSIRITVSKDFIVAERVAPELTQTEEQSSRPKR